MNSSANLVTFTDFNHIKLKEMPVSARYAIGTLIGLNIEKQIKVLLTTA